VHAGTLRQAFGGCRSVCNQIGNAELGCEEEQPCRHEPGD
jgi:hypothetical protein